MRSALIAGLFGIAFAGCNFGVLTCKQDSECGATAYCDESSGFCVALPAVNDSGMGGGLGGGSGGGGGGSGGGTGGGMAGGGGGSVDLCQGVTCPVGHACEAGSGSCVNHVTSVQLLAPGDGSGFDAGLVPFEARLQTDGTVVELPASLPTTLNQDAGPELQRIGTTANYRATQALQDGQYSIAVHYLVPDAGVDLRDGPAAFRVDTRPPMLSVAGGLPTAVLKRDDILVIALESDEAVLPASVEVRIDGLLLERDTRSACTAVAQCWIADLSLPLMPAMTATFTVTAAATDLVGNRQSSTLGSISVSRRRWEVSLGGLEAIRAAPAVGVDGTVYVGTTAALTASLYALNPLDGGALSSPVAVGAVVSVAAATSSDAGLVYFSANDVTGGLVGARTSQLGTSGVNGPERGNAGSLTFSAIALAGGASEVGAVASFNNGISAGRVKAYWPNSAASSTGNANPVTALDFSSSTNEPPNNIIVDGTTAYLLTRPGGSGLYRRTVTGVQAGNNLTDGTAQTIAGGGNALTIGQGYFDGASLVGGTNTIFTIHRLGSPSLSTDFGTSEENGLAAMSNNRAFAGRGTSLISFDPVSLQTPPVVLSGGVGSIRTSPLLGAPRPDSNQALGYAVSLSGALWVFAQEGAAGSASSWGNVFVGNDGVLAHPNLDCNRRPGAAAATTGVMYVASTSGRVAAIIVDSPKLLSSAATWPRYQRTAGNAGNPAFEVNPGCP